MRYPKKMLKDLASKGYDVSMYKPFAAVTTGGIEAQELAKKSDDSPEKAARNSTRVLKYFPANQNVQLLAS